MAANRPQNAGRARFQYAHRGSAPAPFRGRVELRGGCFFVGFDGQPANKWRNFITTGLDVDHAGYFFALTGLGRGYELGRPSSGDIDTETEQALRGAWGSGEIYIVGSPQARERFLTQYPHLQEPRVPPLSPSILNDKPS